tara:strand:- start:332 stop:559 length:228 start_codon:yes stop_codon:yes gene_type:complete
MTKQAKNLSLTIGATSPIGQNQFATDGRALAYLAEKQRKRNARRDALILTLGGIVALGLMIAPFAIYYSFLMGLK